MPNIKVIYSEEHAVLVRRLREARLAAGLTQGELAKRLGRRTHSSIVKLEQGQVRVEVLELRRICQALGIPFTTFIAEMDRELTERRPPIEDGRQV